MGLKEAYKQTHRCLSGVGLGECVEPYTHVSAVDALRLEYRPKFVRFLIIAESHVRKSDGQFAETGPGLVFNPRHPTPWWEDLLFPGFGGTASKSVFYREKCLARLKDNGFWVLDASILALSGYQKVDPNWGPRPLDDYRQQVVRDSWHYYTGAILDSILTQKEKPVVVLYTRVLEMLGEQLRADVAVSSFLLKFRRGSNDSIYEATTYPHGTSRFREAAIQAGLERCLRKI
jgi:hypothetical protein